MKQITIQVQDDQQVAQIQDVLADFDFIKSIDVDTLWSADWQKAEPIKIIETEIGPMISESRTSVYDVMEAHDEGYSDREIHEMYNLSYYQIQVALAYIKNYRAKLEPELKEVQRKQAENEAYHRALVAEREKEFVKEMTPERMKFNELLERSRRNTEIISCK